MARLREHKMPPYYWALFRNIVLLIIIVSTIPIVLVSTTLYLQFRTSYREKVDAHLRELVHKHAQNIDSFLNQRMADIRFLARSFGYENLSNEYRPVHGHQSGANRRSTEKPLWPSPGYLVGC